ncbi:MAG: acetyltransferase [Cytophagales bacterium]|nr:acetyltransferase [Cytophagales bacterium]
MEIKQRGFTKLPDAVILWGGTGQAKVNRSIIEYYGSKVVAVFDDTPNLISPFQDVEIYCGWNAFLDWINSRLDRSEIGFSIAIGNPHGRVRLKLQEKLIHQGLNPISVIHPTATIAKNATIGRGVQIMAGAIIQPEVKIGDQCIINTNASVDHEDILEDGVEIGPGATLCGNVHIEVNGWIAAGAVILPRLKIGHDSIVGAGSLITKDVLSGLVVYGSPAKEIRKL